MRAFPHLSDADCEDMASLMDRPSAIKWLTRLQLDDGEDFAGLEDEDWIVLTALRVSIDGVEYEIPAGLVTDGGSIPTGLQTVVGERWSRPARKPFVFHDACYKRRLLRIAPGELEPKPVAITQKFADDTLYELLRAGGIGWLRRHRIWAGLRVLGWVAWSNDGKKQKKGTS